MKFYACIPNVLKLAARVKERKATSYDKRIERNGVDGYVWLEREDENILVLGFKNQNLKYLVYVITKYNEKEIHLRQIWEEYPVSITDDTYVMGKSTWDSIENPTYKDVVCHGHEAIGEYSDDFFDENGENINPKYHYVKRPSLITHQKKEKNVGFRFLDGRDEGYIASVKVNILTEVPYCDSPTAAMQGFLEYIFMDFKSVLEIPCLEGDED